MDYQQRIRAFLKLGEWLTSYLDTGEEDRTNREFFDLNQAIESACQKNKWFTPDSCRLALSGIIEFTKQDVLDTWLNTYQINTGGKTIGVVMAGNIPLVGFHDLLCVLISGHNLQCKLSSEDEVLLPFLTNKLCELEPNFKGSVKYSEKNLKNFDAVIATGSNNTSRYFEYYFGKYPHVIRQNRNGVAVLNGEESSEDIKGLGNDIFSYFGLGCRNVSKIYVPMGYDLAFLLKEFETWVNLMEHNKYANNYDYNRTLYQMKQLPVLDNGVVILEEKKSIASPISVVYYEHYRGDPAALLEEKKDEIQCIVSGKQLSNNLPVIPFGMAQFPKIDDYADGVDIMAFLNSL